MTLEEFSKTEFGLFMQEYLEKLLDKIGNIRNYPDLSVEDRKTIIQFIENELLKKIENYRNPQKTNKAINEYY